MAMTLPISIPSSPSSRNSPASTDDSSNPPRTPVSPASLQTLSLPLPDGQQQPQQQQQQYNTNNTSSNNAQAPKRKPSRRANTAERRATHNAVERQRRETLNGRFLDLAALLPNLSQIRRPSKSSIVNSSIAHVHASRRHRMLAARELRLLKLESDALRRELNEWRDRAGLPRVEEPARSEGYSMVMSGELEVLATIGEEEGDEGDEFGEDEMFVGTQPAGGAYGMDEQQQQQQHQQQHQQQAAAAAMIKQAQLQAAASAGGHFYGAQGQQQQQPPQLSLAHIIPRVSGLQVHGSHPHTPVGGSANGPMIASSPVSFENPAVGGSALFDSPHGYGAHGHVFQDSNGMEGGKWAQQQQMYAAQAQRALYSTTPNGATSTPTGEHAPGSFATRSSPRASASTAGYPSSPSGLSDDSASSASSRSHGTPPVDMMGLGMGGLGMNALGFDLGMGGMMGSNVRGGYNGMNGMNGMGAMNMNGMSVGMGGGGGGNGSGFAMMM